MFRLRSVKQIRGYRETFIGTEDLDLWLRLGEIGRLANIPCPVLRFRFLSASINGQNASLQKQPAKNACQETSARRKVGYPFGGMDWRATREAKSRFNFFMKFAWWTFDYHERDTAIIHRLKAIILLPWKFDGSSPLVCTPTKPQPTTI